MSAFPGETMVTWNEKDGEKIVPNHGVSKLEYFAARAPKKIPGWFQPCLDEISGGQKPKEVQPFHFVFGNSSSHKHSEFIKRHWFDEDGCFVITDKSIKIPEGLEDEIRQWEIDIDKYLKDKKTFEAILRRETIAQWPWYWANIVLDSKYELKQH